MPLTQVVAGNRILASDLNQFYNILKGVAASGEAVTLIFNAAGSLVFQPSSDPATGTELIQIKNNAGTVQAALSSDGKVYSADGTVALPGLTWEQEKATGFYRISSNKIGVSVNNSEKMRIDATGVSVDGGVSYLPLLTPTFWNFHWNPAMSGASTEYTVTGTGSQAVTAGKLENVLATGATSGGTAGIRTVFGSGGTGKGGSGKCRRLEIVAAITSNANNQAHAFLTDETVATIPSFTARHLGIRSANAVVVFSTADGTTEQTTDISTAFPADDSEHRAVITYDGTTARCYVDGVLAATHSTNVPSVIAINPVMRWFIVNTAASNKTLRASSFDVVLAT